MDDCEETKAMKERAAAIRKRIAKLLGDEPNPTPPLEA
jgi:hypothetical protein